MTMKFSRWGKNTVIYSSRKIEEPGIITHNKTWMPLWMQKILNNLDKNPCCLVSNNYNKRRWILSSKRQNKLRLLEERVLNQICKKHPCRVILVWSKPNKKKFPTIKPLKIKGICTKMLVLISKLNCRLIDELAVLLSRVISNYQQIFRVKSSSRSTM